MRVLRSIVRETVLDRETRSKILTIGCFIEKKSGMSISRLDLKVAPDKSPMGRRRVGRPRKRLERQGGRWMKINQLIRLN